jgi:iron complex transport system permease protein
MSTTALPAGDLDRSASRRAGWLYAGLMILVVAALALNLANGSLEIAWPELTRLLLAGPGDDPRGMVVWDIRLPRALAALWGGACLAVSGLLLQVYFRNPVVGPFILGISSGASLVVALVMLTSFSLGLATLSPYLVTLAAFAGSLGALLLVVGIARRMKQGVVLLIIGLMIGYLTSAVTSLLAAFAEAERLKGFTLWTLGSFSGFRWQELQMVILLGGVLLVGVYGLSKPLNAFLLGEDYAQSMGVNVRAFRVLIIFFSCALAALVTATAGPVAFIGLAVPHMARLSLGTADNRLLLPAAALLGGLVTLLCDLVARSLFAPVETPLSAVTSFLGAPVVIFLLMRRRGAL